MTASTSTTSRASLITDQLEKPQLDDRSYRVIQLPNKLEALLIHDAETDKASASLNVNVGNFSDEEDMPGMAHAVEHLLFMGTKKYPVENEYSSYLSAHGGYSNAYTAATQTNYFFECAAHHDHQEPNGIATKGDLANGNSSGVSGSPLYGALDRFAQFFVEPLFLESTLDRELRAVDSENKKNLQSDNWRLSQLGKSLSNPKHPYSHFSTGNLQTLRDEPLTRGVKIREEFINFYKRHYSANRMKLVVLGRESLDELETWVEELFSEVENKDLQENRWDDETPFTKKDMSTQVFAKPIKDSRSLEIWFPFHDEEDMYETQPSRFISHLLGHEGPGSVLAYLKEKGWATSLSAGAYPVCPGSAFFEMEIRLTTEGLKQYPEIVKTVFHYISIMQENPPLEWMFDEMKNMTEVDFRFKQKAPASRTSSTLSATMQKKLPREWLLSGTSKLRRFDADAIIRAIQFMRHDNFRLMIVSQDQPSTGPWNRREKWYGTEYKVEHIPSDVSSEIREALENSNNNRPKELHLPHKNEFIPTKLIVQKKEVAEPAKTPNLILKNDIVRLWWKKDDRFWVPKANTYIILRNPLAYSTPANYVKTQLFASLVKDSLTEYSYDAEISGLGYGLHASALGLEISVNGYNDKMHVLLQKVLESMRDLQVKPERFEIIKERLSRQYKNWDYQQPYYQLSDFSRLLTNERAWINHQYALELPHITLADLNAFFPQLLAQAHFEILTHGNMYKEDALRIASVTTSTIKPRSLATDLWPLRRNLLLPSGSNFVFKRDLIDPAEVNSVIEYYLQIGPNTDLPLRAKLQLFAQICEEPAFDVLRTKEQLGYIVFSGVRPSATTMGFRVLIQSERLPAYLESRIDAFLSKIGHDLDSMSDEAFEGHRRSIISKKLEKVKNLEAESGRLWGYIGSEMYNFYQVDRDVADLRKVSKDEVRDFFAQFVDPVSQTRRKISVQMTARAAPAEPEVEAESQTVLGSPAPNEYAQTGQDEAAVTNGTADGTSLVEKVTDFAKDALSNLKLTNGTDADTEVAADGTLVPSKTKIPEVFIDESTVSAWKASMQVSNGPRPVEDLAQFEELEAKL